MTSPAVLVVTCVEDTTADSVIEQLNSRGVGVARFDLVDFFSRLTLNAWFGDAHACRGHLVTPSRHVEFRHARALYWRRPTNMVTAQVRDEGARFVATEARWGLEGVLTGMSHWRFVNHPHRAWAAEYKPRQLMLARELGWKIPATLITNDHVVARDFVATNGPAIYKPFESPYVERGATAHTVWTQVVEAEEIDSRVGDTAHLFQRRIPKIADLRLTVVGDTSFAVRITSRTGLLDWRRDYSQLSYEVVGVPTWLHGGAVAYLQRQGLLYGCFDFAIGENEELVFLECNPSGQWGWLEDETGLPISAAFADLLASD